MAREEAGRRVTLEVEVEVEPPHERLAAALDIEVDRYPLGGYGLPYALHYSVARPAAGPPVEGYGSGGTRFVADRAAVMECVERWAQFAPPAAPATIRATAAELGDRAIPPPAFGLYGETQYRVPGFGLAPFSPQDPLDWVEVADLQTRERRLVPVELVYPHLALDRPRIVAESSSGTAAHTDPEAAERAALLEAVERDGLMLFWYRQPPTPAYGVDAVEDAEARDALSAVRDQGFVVTIARLDYDLPVPRFLVVALRGRDFAYGLGCELRHAVRELHASIPSMPGIDPPSRPLRDVDKPRDHLDLYHRGPLHGVLRDQLARTFRPAPGAPDAPPPGDVVGALAERGLRAYVHHMPWPEGAHVARVLVPGLVPIHFGFDRTRLGCERLVGRDAPGRLATLLPHFVA